MKVTLINWTRNAPELLIFTKSTRLNLSPALLVEVASKSDEEMRQELEYIANTIPSSWEFVDYVFLVEGVSRAYTHQAVRTRAASYAQQSMRVNNMGDFDYIYPEEIEKDTLAKLATNNLLSEIKKCYNYLIALGHQPEDARGILPTNISTNIVCKFNLRTLSDLVKSRTGGRTQSEYQGVVNAMADEVLKIHPWADKFLFPRERNFFDEIEAFAKAKFPDLKERGELLKIVDAMRKAKP